MKMQCMAMILLAVMAVVLIGCDGSGGMGGQGLRITVNQHQPQSEAEVATPEGSAKGGNASVIQINIRDGGTEVLSNPLPESPDEEKKTSPGKSEASSPAGP